MQSPALTAVAHNRVQPFDYKKIPSLLTMALLSSHLSYEVRKRRSRAAKCLSSEGQAWLVDAISDVDWCLIEQQLVVSGS